MRRLTLVLIALIASISMLAAQTETTPLIPGEPVSGDVADETAYTINLEAAESILITLESDVPAYLYIEPWAAALRTPTVYEFNAPADDTYTITLEPGDDDVTEGAYTLEVTRIEQTPVEIGDEVVIPAGTASPYYVTFPADVTDYFRVSADDDSVSLRVEDTGGMPTVYNGSTFSNMGQTFGSSMTLPPFSTGTHRAVIVAPDDAPDFPNDVTVRIEPLDALVETIAVGESVSMTSDQVTTLMLDLDANQAVRVDFGNDFRGWMHVIVPERGSIYRSGHAASGGPSGTMTYVATEPGQLALRISGAGQFAADGSFSVTVTEIPVQALTAEPLTLTNADGFLTFTVEAGQSYRLTVQADAEITLGVGNANATGAVAAPSIGMHSLLETVRVWEASTSGRVFLNTSPLPEDVDVRVWVERAE